MKLKQAKKYAKAHGARWIAVDKDKRLYGYYAKPHLSDYIDMWLANGGCTGQLGFYTGKKRWTETRTEVPQ